jgi:hypothetical protein
MQKFLMFSAAAFSSATRQAHDKSLVQQQLSAGGYDGVLAFLNADDVANGLDPLLPWLLEQPDLSPQMLIEIGLLPDGNEQDPTAYYAAADMAFATVRAAGRVCWGVRGTPSIRSPQPEGLSYWFDQSGMSLDAITAKGRANADAAAAFVARNPGVKVTFPILNPGSAWMPDEADALRHAMLKALGDAVLFGQLAFPTGYEQGQRILNYAPRLFGQANVTVSKAAAIAQAEAIPGMQMLEIHAGQPD